MKKTAVVKFVGKQEHYCLGCDERYAYCRDCKECKGSGNYKFVYGKLYNAYFLEYWQGNRTSLHIKGEDGKIDDFVPLEDFEIVLDEDNVLNTYVAVVKFISHENDDKSFGLAYGLSYGKEYKAIGFNEQNQLLVMDESWDCYFYSRKKFEIVSDPHNILDETCNDPIYNWEETHIDSI